MGFRGRRRWGISASARHRLHESVDDGRRCLRGLNQSEATLNEHSPGERLEPFYLLDIHHSGYLGWGEMPELWTAETVERLYRHGHYKMGLNLGGQCYKGTPSLRRVSKSGWPNSRTGCSSPAGTMPSRRPAYGPGNPTYGSFSTGWKPSGMPLAQRSRSGQPASRGFLPTAADPRRSRIPGRAAAHPRARTGRQPDAPRRHGSGLVGGAGRIAYPGRNLQGRR